MTLRSMTGFGRADGTAGGMAWAWELRSVNGRGLDLKLRLPGALEAMEPELRALAATKLKRGNVGANLSFKREERPRLAADPALLDELLALATTLAARVQGAPPPRVELLLGLPGVIRAEAAEEGLPEVAAAAVRDGFARALDALMAARAAEGARLGGVIAGQLDEIEALCRTAAAQAADQPGLVQAKLAESLAALLRGQPGPAPERMAAEVALLATRADVREELDRLEAHLAAARDLLGEAAAGEGVGRRFDFLVQEFVRETNTLCSKSASVPLTATGLKLKAATEQMREQVQNVE